VIHLPKKTVRSSADDIRTLSLECPSHYLPYLISQIRGDGITDLVVLLGTVTHEEVVVREGLDTGRLPDRETAGLGRIVVDVVVTVF
jgi:hypothetical protein